MINIFLEQDEHKEGASALRLSLLILSSLFLVLATAPIYSQTEFTIQADSSDLKGEYQKELDKWMLRAYGGDRDAQFKVGVLFANDQFGPPDLEQSSYWYTQAARQGHVLAQYNLGHQHLMGNGVKRDEKVAMQWWLKAAEQQHALAQFNVGRAYYLGIGLKKDLSLAKLWFERASQNNEPKSTEILKQLGWWDERSVASVSQPVPASVNEVDQVIELPKEIINVANKQDDSVTDTENSTSPTTSADEQTTSVSREASWKVDRKSNASANTAITTLNNEPEKDITIAVFTDPSIRSVLITMLENAAELKVVSEDDKWSIVESNKGLPAWVSKNFIRADGARGVVTGNSVNARSVPLITSGSIVGRLNRNETVAILDSRGEWYRIRSPKRFKGWVKSNELLLASPNIKRPTPPLNNQATSKKTTINEGDLPQLQSNNNDNDWLFGQNATQYTLQLASFSDPLLLTRYVNTLSFKDSKDLRLFTARNDEGVNWTYVLYGTYPDDETAKDARRDLNQKRAWVRRFGILQQNRCLGWKKELPAPKQLNEFCT
ncbi:hypothetical protein NBRC116583_17600 [Arenicella sp. 4NH20-0111]|uniref:SH3 domain-containing protein n=1 Tax=Arenicella sp. 4NH20-0111 TaxID=3127648 RepID=UPI00310ABBA0